MAEAEDNHWVRVELSRRREQAALAAQVTGRARRARRSRWRALLGLGREGAQ